MEYQQKLLLVFAIFLIGVAINVGMQKFQKAAAEANRDALFIYLAQIAGKAQCYFKKPVFLDGGDGSFASVTEQQLFDYSENENGSFRIIAPHDQDMLHIEATGRYDSDKDGILLTIRMMVQPDSFYSTVINH